MALFNSCPINASSEEYSDYVEFVGLCDKNKGRVETVQKMLGVTCPTFTTLVAATYILSLFPVGDEKILVIPSSFWLL